MKRVFDVFALTKFADPATTRHLSGRVGRHSTQGEQRDLLVARFVPFILADHISNRGESFSKSLNGLGRLPCRCSHVRQVIRGLPH